MERVAFDDIPAATLDTPKKTAFDDIPSMDLGGMYGGTESVDRKIKENNDNFNAAVESGVSMNDLDFATDTFRPITTPRTKTGQTYASRISNGMWNATVSNVVRTLTDPDFTAAQQMAGTAMLEYEKKKGMKFSDEAWDAEISDVSKELYLPSKNRTIDYIKDLPQLSVPEQVSSYFDPRENEEPEGYIETGLDAMTGILGFATQLKAFGLMFPKVPAYAGWEAVGIANGQKPGSGSSMYGAMGLIGKFVPGVNPVARKLTGGVGVGGIFGTTTYLAGGSTEEIIVNSGIPILLGAMSIKSSDWQTLKKGTKYQMLRETVNLEPALKGKSLAEMDKAVHKILLKQEVAGIRSLGKKPVAGAKPKPQLTPEQIASRKPIKATGEIVASKTSLKIQENAIFDELVGKEGFETLSMHAVSKVKKQIKLGNDIPNSDALKMVLGEKPFPVETLENSVYLSVRNRARANGDLATLKALSAHNSNTLANTRRGQELNILRGETRYDPVKMAQNVSQSRGVMPDKKLSKNLAKAQSKLDKSEANLSKKIIDLEIKKLTDKPKAVKVDIQSKKYGAKNKIVTKAKYDAAWKRLGEQKLTTGIDPAKFADVIEISAYHLEAVGRNLPAWSKAMTDQFGDKIKPHLKTLWAKAGEKISIANKTEYITKLRDAYGKDKSLVGQTTTIRKLQRSLIGDGLTKREPLLNEMHRILNEIDPTITRRQAMDAMSGSGKFKLLPKDEISVIRRDLNTQYQQLSKLQDMSKGKAPPATGFERQEPSAESRKLTQMVNEAKKKGGFTSVSPERELKTAIKSIETRKANRITDLKAQIKSGKKTIKTKRPQPTSAKIEKLNAELEILQKEYDAMFGQKKLSPEQRIVIAEKSLKRDLAEYDRRIKEADFSEKGKAKTPETAELKALKSKRDAIKAEYELARDIANPDRAGQIELQALKTRIANERAHYDEMIQNKDFSRPEKTEYVLDKKAEKLTAERDASRRAYRTARELSEQKGGISTDEMKQLNDRSNKIESTKQELALDPMNKQKQIEFGRSILDFEEYGLSIAPKETSVRSVTVDVLGTPRTLMTSIDLSFPFRQGWGMMSTPEFWKGFQKQFGYAWSEANFKTLQAEIRGHPRYDLAKKSGLGLTDLGENLIMREEGMQSTLPDRIWVAGRLVRGSQRAYTGMANYVRWNRWNAIMDAAELQGRTLKGTQGKAMATDAANIVNIFTGRGNLGLPQTNRKTGEKRTDTLGKVSPEINQFLFSARKLSADINMLDPRLYIGAGKYTMLDPIARKAAQRQLVGSVAMTSTILGMAHMAGLEVETDPHSKLFGHVKAGGKWVDLTGGKSTVISFMMRAMTDKTVDWETGELIDSTAESKARELFRAGRSKMAPVPSLVLDLWLRKDYMGNELEEWVDATQPFAVGSRSKAVMSRFVPMSISDSVDIMADDVYGDMFIDAMANIPFMVPVIFGSSVKTDKKKKTKAETF